MVNPEPTFYGILLLLLGLGLLLLIAILIHWLSKLSATPPRHSFVQPDFIEAANEQAAILKIKPGGRVAHINQNAKTLFQLRGKLATLENLARCVQPKNSFLNLCANQGQTTFSINGRIVEGISYPIPHNLTADKQPEIMVSLVQPSLATSQSVQLHLPHLGKDKNSKPVRIAPSIHTIKTLMEISQEISKNLDLDQTILAILENCKKFIPADFMELTIWEDAAQPPQSYCLPIKSDEGSQAKRSPHKFSVGYGYTAWLIAKREPLLIDYVQNSAEIRPDLDQTRYPYRSYLGYPLILDRHLIGTLEFASLEENTYHQEDLSALNFFSGQIVLALQHAFLFHGEHRKASELSALVDLTQAINAIREPQDLFQHLLESISPLLAVQVLGFIILDETRRTLKAQLPFQGVHAASVVDWYQCALKPGGASEELWSRAETIITDHAAEDKNFKALELDHFARIAGIRQSVLVPLTSSGQMLGYLLVGNKINGECFDQDDTRFLKIISGKAAPIIENANLVQLSRQRAQRAEVLRRIASLAKSNATIHETLKFSTLDLARLLQADSAAIFLLDPTGQELNFHPESAFGLPGEEFQNFRGISTQEPGYSQTVCHTQKLIITGNLEKLDPIPILYQPFSQNLHIQSLIAIPILYNQQGIGELVLGSQRLHHFSNHDIHTAITACELMVAGFDLEAYFKGEMPADTDLMRQIPDQASSSGISQQTQRRNLFPLQNEQQKTKTLLHIFSELSASLDLKHVLHSTLKVLGEYADAQYISIWVPQPGKSDFRSLVKVSDALNSLQADDRNQNGWDQEIAGAIMKQDQPVLIEDILQEPAWQQNGNKGQPEQLYRSMLGAPLVNGTETLGSLLLFHKDLAHFSIDLVELVQAVAQQVSMAINQSNIYQLIHDQAEDFGILLRNQKVENSRTKAILEAVADGVLVTDAKRKITLFNHSAERILGLESKKVVGKSLEYFLGLFGEAAQNWMQTIDQWTKSPETFTSGETFSQQISLDDGKMIFVRLTPVLFNRDFLGTVSIFQDITHQVELDRLKSEFVATVSHELRTPMTSIKGYADILLMGAAGSLSDPQKHFLDIIQSNADRLSILVNDLLDISRIELGRDVLTLQPLNLEEILGKVLERYRTLAQQEHKSISFIKDLPANLPRVFGDYERVGQVLNNLIDNAYRYNLENGSVCIHAHKVNSHVQIEIQDTGVGIPPNELSSVFERFFRGETPLNLGVSGTGLGLSIVKNWVEMHQGQIWAESSGISGEGTKVTFTLPEYNPHS